MAKKPSPTETTMDAPLVLKRLQYDAAKFATQIDDAEARLAALEALPGNKQDKEQLARIETELSNANERFNKTAKTLLSFDKGVSSERKEGEKVSVSEAKEIFAQFLLCIDLAFEQCVIADAQSAALAESPEQFHKAHADNWRSAKDGAVLNAISDGAIPKWIAL